jgi:diguanylate cyclase
MIPPLKFLPLAERAGLMRDLTEWVLEEALGQCASWRATGDAAAVSVNVSATNVVDAGFTAMVQDLLERHRLPPEAVVLEITETSIITEFDRATVVVEELRSLGIVVSIDDFGTGFTSLAYLRGLSAGELKLDRTFITDLTSGERDRDLQLVRSTIELGHALGMRVVAEGIEDEDTLDLLRDLKCDVAQGYFIGVPEPAEKIAFAADVQEREPRAPAHGRSPASWRTPERTRAAGVLG